MGLETVGRVVLLGILALFASGAGTLTGFGTSTVMVPVLVLWYSLPETLLFVGIVHWFGDIWKMLFFKKGVRWKLILGFGVPGVLASYIGASVSLGIGEKALSQILGAFLMLYVAFLLVRPSWQLPDKEGLAAVGGLLSGFFAGIFGVGGAIRSTFLSAFDLEKSVYIFTGGAIAFVVDATRIATYVSGGTRLEEMPLAALAVAVPASLAGAYLAKKVLDRIPQQGFRRVIAVFLAVVGIKALLFP
jgi:uncharacterized membrane protein YfcA